MNSMVLEKPGTRLRLMNVPDPEPRSGQVLVKVVIGFRSDSEYRCPDIAKRHRPVTKLELPFGRSLPSNSLRRYSLCIL
jgi:hypothetical protein